MLTTETIIFKNGYSFIQKKYFRKYYQIWHIKTEEQWPENKYLSQIIFSFSAM